MINTPKNTFDGPRGEIAVVSPFERIFANFFSVILHPLFLPVYVIIFLIYLHPSAFSGFSDHEKRQTVLIILLNIVFFPLVSVLLLKALGFISSIYLHNRKDRIIPYIAAGIFFFWAYTVFKEQPRYPVMLTSFILGIFLASSIALIANIYFKISMHAIGMGGLLGFLLVVLKTQTMHMPWVISLAILLTGIVCTARLLVSDHSAKDLTAGLLTGMVTQAAAAMILM